MEIMKYRDIFEDDSELSHFLAKLIKPAVIFVQTKKLCDRLASRLNSCPDTQGALPVHGGLGPGIREANIQQLKDGTFWCACATEAAHVHISRHYEPNSVLHVGAPEDFWGRDEDVQRVWVTSVGQRYTLFLLNPDDAKAAPSLCRAFQNAHPSMVLPEWLGKYTNDAPVASLSARKLRRGVVPSLVGDLPRVSIDPKVEVMQASNTCKLHFIFAISGPLFDRSPGKEYVSSWVPQDKSFLHRRDALARCLVAALWHRPPRNGLFTSVYGNHSVSLLYSVWPFPVVHITHDFARCVGSRVAPHEALILQLLDDAVRGRRSIPGVTIEHRHQSLDEAAAAGIAINLGDSAEGYVLELHDSLGNGLPIFKKKVVKAIKKKTQSVERRPLVVVTLGCVDDQVEVVSKVLAAGCNMGLKQIRVNLGPVAEFSSKVVHIIQAHNDAKILAPALRYAERGYSIKSLKPPCDLHFWYWCSDLQVADCVGEGSTHSSKRSDVWLLPNAALAAVTKSHGAYSHTEGLPAVCLSFVFKDYVLTLDASLVHKYVGDRGWGALTEHHLLTAMQNVLDADRRAGHDFRSVFTHRTQCTAHKVLAICEKASFTLPLYDSMAAPQPSGMTIHLMLEPPQHAINEAASIAGSVYECKLPTDTELRCTVRTIVFLQAINNYGRLLAAVHSLMPLQTLGEPHTDVTKKRKGSKKGKKRAKRLR